MALSPALTPPLPATADSPPSLELLLAIAETHHSEFRVQVTDYEINREAAPRARANLLPQVNAIASHRYNNTNQSGGGGGGGAGGAGGGDNTSWSAGISASQIIYHAPQWHLWQAAEAQSAAAALRLDALRQTLHRDVILAWLNVQRAAETLRLVEKRRKTLRAQLARTEALAASGQVIEADVLLARARVSSAQAQWEQAKHDLAIAHDEVIRITGVDIPEKLLVLGEGASLPSLPPLPPLREWQARAGTHNLSLLAARRNTAAVQQRLKAASGAILPRISLSGAFTANDSLGDTSHSWQLQLEQSLFSGGDFSASKRQLMAESDKSHAEVAAVMSQNTQRLKQLHGQMRADLARLAALNEETMARDALLQVVTLGYDNGVNIITEVLTAEEDLFNAQINLQQAAYGYLQNLVTANSLLARIDPSFAGQIERLFAAAPQ